MKKYNFERQKPNVVGVLLTISAFFYGGIAFFYLMRCCGE